MYHVYDWTPCEGKKKFIVYKPRSNYKDPIIIPKKWEGWGHSCHYTCRLSRLRPNCITNSPFISRAFYSRSSFLPPKLSFLCLFPSFPLEKFFCESCVVDLEPKMYFTRKLSFLVFLLCLFFSVKNQNAETNKGSLNRNWFSSYSSPFSRAPMSSRSMMNEAIGMERKTQETQFSGYGSLRYDYYNETCPEAEQIVKSTVQQLYSLRPSVAPEFLRLVFHDCFIQVISCLILMGYHLGFLISVHYGSFCLVKLWYSIFVSDFG